MAHRQSTFAYMYLICSFHSITRMVLNAHGNIPKPPKKKMVLIKIARYFYVI